MELTVDVGFVAASRDRDGYVTLGGLVAMVRRPLELVRLLWGRRWDRVTIVADGLPPSAVQAGGLLLCALMRTRRLEIVTPAGTQRLARASFLARSIVGCAVALVREVGGGLRVHRRAQKRLAEPLPEPIPVTRPATVAYLRPAPLLRYLGEYVGGAAAHTTGVINGFVANGVDVNVYAPERPERTPSASFDVVPLRRAFHFVPWLTVTAYGQDIADAASASPADFVYQRYLLGSYAGLELSERLDVPFVLEFNGSEIWAHTHWGNGRLPLLDMLTAIERRNLDEAALIVVVSDVLREDLLAQGLDPGRVLANPNGVDVDSLAPLRERTAAEWRAELGRPEVPTIGFVGTFGLWHGVTVLPAMVEATAAEVPEARWILIGDGPLHDQVRTELEERGQSDRVELTGVVAHEEALRLLSACDVCVSPHVRNPDGTRFFGSPTKLFEYMGLAKPIVASDLEQIGDVLEHEETALMTEPGDAEAAAAAVVRLLSDEPLRARLAAGALAEAERTYSWDAHVRRILDALAQVGAPPAARLATSRTSRRSSGESDTA